MRVSDSMSRVTALGCDFVRNGHNGAAVWNGSRCCLASACNSELNGYHGVQVCDADSRCSISESNMSGNNQCGLCVAEGARASVTECSVVNNMRTGLAVMPTGGHLALMSGTEVWDNASGSVWAATKDASVRLHRGSRVLGQMQAMEGARVDVVL